MITSLLRSQTCIFAKFPFKDAKVGGPHVVRKQDVDADPNILSDAH